MSSINHAMLSRKLTVLTSAYDLHNAGKRDGRKELWIQRMAAARLHCHMRGVTCSFLADDGLYREVNEQLAKQLLTPVTDAERLPGKGARRGWDPQVVAAAAAFSQAGRFLGGSL